MTDATERRGWLPIAAAVAATVPALALASGGLALGIGIETVLFGLAILGAAFLLSWGAEVAQLDISRGLAIAFLAFIAVLPEYAVDLVFAWNAGAQDAAAGALPDLCGAQERCRELSVANMTGSNRLLIGLGWATVVLLSWRRSGRRGVRLDEPRRTDLGFLLVASLWALTIPLRGSLSLLDLCVLAGLFALYLWHVLHEEQQDHELIGPPVLIAALGVTRRRIVTAVLFVGAAAVILLSAEPFAQGLVESAQTLGLPPFLAVQWLAPLASEAPEMLIAILFVLRAQPNDGLGALVSSKVNQWTLLVGTIPLVYAISIGGAIALPLDQRQRAELFLTASQSLFAITLLARLELSIVRASVLLVLFLAQFGIADPRARIVFGVGYLVAAIALLVAQPATRQGLAGALGRVLTRPSR